MNYRIVFLLFLFPLFSSAQSSEIGLFFGGTAYQGDLSPTNKRLDLSAYHPALGVFGRHHFSPAFAVRLGINFGVISAKDADSDVESRQERNLSFRSRLWEVNALGELHLLSLFPATRYSRLSPYLFGGVALFRFNPEANYNGQLVELQPLGTEGQGMTGFASPYKLTQISIPMGVGLRFAINDYLNLGFEVGLRKTFTDYLDDVSGSYVNYNELLAGNGQLAAALGNRTGEYLGTEPVLLTTGTQRANPEEDDWYITSGLTLSYSFNKREPRNTSRRNQELGCPKF